MDVFVIQMLVFLAILFLVTGVNAVVRKEDMTLPGSKPLMFRVFHAEVGTVGKMTGPWTDHTFPVQARQLRSDIIAGALPLEVSEIRGMQGFSGAVIAAITCIMVFVVSMNWAYAILGGLLVGLMANYTGFLLPKVALFSNIALMVAILLWRPQGVYPVANR